MFTYLKGGHKEDAARLLSGLPIDRTRGRLPIDRTRGNGPNLKHGRFPLNIRKQIFIVRVRHQALAQFAQGYHAVTILLEIQKLF